MSCRNGFLLALLGLLVLGAPSGAYAQLTASTPNGDRVVTDAATGLIWADTPSGILCGPGCPGGASAWVATLNANGYAGFTTGWRLPTIEELAYLYGELPTAWPFLNIGGQGVALIWSNTLASPGGLVYLLESGSTIVSGDPEVIIGLTNGAAMLQSGAMAVRGTALTRTCTAQTSGSGTYSAIEIPPAGNDNGTPLGFALNSCGEVTGGIYSDGLNPQVFLYRNGITTDLGADNGLCASNAGAIGYGINASDTIIGANCADSEYQSPMLYFKGASSIIPFSVSLVASSAIAGEGRAINSSGQIAGYVQVTNASCADPDVFQPFVYDTSSGVAQDLSTAITAIAATDCSAQALAINDAGQIAGYFSDRGSAPHAFVYNPTNGKAIDLGNLGYQFTYAYGINATGDATGWSSNSISSGLPPDAFLYTSGTPPAGLKCYPSTPINPSGNAYICDLGNLGIQGVYQGSGGSQGNAINASDQITGYSWTLVNSVYVKHAFLYSNGVMQDLNNLVSQCTNPSGNLVGCTLVNGVAINDAGQILVQGYLNSNPSQTVTFLLSPPPSSITVPNVAGATQSAASATIVSSGLIVGTVTSQSSSTIASGSVISQSPIAGASVAGGSPVNLVVSSGPPTVAIALDGAPVIASTAAGWSVTVTLQNNGNVTVSTLPETSATLGGVAQSAAVGPITALAPGASNSFVLSFPAAAGTAGTSVSFKVNGSYSATALSGNWSVSLRGVALP